MRDSRVNSIPMQLEQVDVTTEGHGCTNEHVGSLYLPQPQILKSGKDPENSLRTIEDFEKEILQLGLKPDVEKKFLVRLRGRWVGRSMRVTCTNFVYILFTHIHM